MSARVLFITGTDTGVGKTAVTAAFARLFLRRNLRVGVMKPVASGCTPPAAGRSGISGRHTAPGKHAPASRAKRTLISEDAIILREAAGSDDPFDLITPIALTAPLSPHMAARLDGRPLSRGTVLAQVEPAFHSLCERHDVLLVEGVGGLLVPLGDRFTFADLVQALMPKAAACWIVAADKLGAISHTLLTAEAIRHRGGQVPGVILNRVTEPDFAAQTNAEALRLATDIPVFGPIPCLPGAVDIERIADALDDAGVADALTGSA